MNSWIYDDSARAVLINSKSKQAENYDNEHGKFRDYGRGLTRERIFSHWVTRQSHNDRPGVRHMGHIRLFAAKSFKKGLWN
jgi:hypothetical protein